MIIKRNLLFFIDKEGTKAKGYKFDGKLRLRIRYEKNKVDFNLGYRVDLKKWSTETQRCKPGTTHSKDKTSATEINTEIQRIETLVNNLFKEYEVRGEVPTADIFREEFNKKNRAELGITDKDSLEELNFFHVFNQFMTEEGALNDWTEGTYEKFRATKNHLTNFDPNLTLCSLGESKLTQYVYYLRDERNMRNSTIEKQLGFLKWFLRWSTTKGFNTSTAFLSFKPKLKSTTKKIIFLTNDELNKLQNYKIPEAKQYLERVRDVFLFQCFTGLRYSDVYNLKRSDIKPDSIEVTTIKTADSLVIEFNDHSKSIIEKYKNIHFENDKALPVISNQKMNDYLKELAELAGIDEPIRESFYKGNERIDTVSPKYALLGTHAGRRTFICNALALGIPPHVVMKWTGHSDYKAMKPYIDIADNIKASAMNKFNQL